MQCKLFIFIDVVRDITTVTKAYNCNDAAKWLAQVLQYNVPRGKKNRGILTVLTYKNLAPPQEVTPDNIKLAQYLGWCVEMVSSIKCISSTYLSKTTYLVSAPELLYCSRRYYG